VIARGDAYWARLAPRSGSEQQGRRPVVVVSHDGFNQVSSWRSVIVVPLAASARQARRGPTVVRGSKGTGGLDSDSAVICLQVTTIGRSKLETRIGVLPNAELLEVGEALKVAPEIL